MENTTKKTHADTTAMDIVRRMVEANPRHYERDFDAVLECGLVDETTETILGGYLWADIVAEMGEMDEDTEESLASALVDRLVEDYYGWVEGCEDEDENDPENDPDLQEYYEARLACEEAASLYGTDSEEYKQACRVFEEAERKADVG